MANKNITPQYQSYGETSARGEQSPMEALTFKVPLTPISKAAARKRKVKVMDEDEYVEKVEKIIERDFLPELEKLKAQSDYMDARDRKDYETMSRLEEKYSGVRPDTGRRMQSPATFDTPLDQPRDTDPRRPQQGAAEGDAEGDKQEGAGAEEGKEDEDRVTLDKFMSNHTSEDNESFIELQVENEKKHRAKNAWMYKDEAMYLEMKAQQMALPSMEQQAALPYKPGNVDTWTYQNINSVFHNPDGLELTEAEKIEKAKKEKIIIHNNTRISKTPWKSDKQVDKLRKEVEQREALAAGKVGQAQDPLGQRVQADGDDPEPGAGRGGLAADDLGPGRDHALHAGRLRHAPGHLGRRPGPGLPDPRPQRPGQDRAAAGGQQQQVLPGAQDQGHGAGPQQPQGRQGAGRRPQSRGPEAGQRQARHQAGHRPHAEGELHPVARKEGGMFTLFTLTIFSN